MNRLLVSLVCFSFFTACGGHSTDLLSQRGDPATLLAKYKERAAQKPLDPMARAGIGVAFLKLQKISRAVQELNRAAMMAPGNAQIARWQGEASLRAQLYRRAQQAFERALKHEPQWRVNYEKDVEPRLLKALTLELKSAKRINELVGVFSRMSLNVRTKHPEMADLLYGHQGNYYFSRGNYRKAIVSYKALTKRSPLTDFHLAQCHAKLGELSKAQPLFDAFVSSGDVAELSGQVAMFLEKNFRFDAAIRFYKKALSARSDDTLKKQLGVTYLKARRVKEARQIFESMLIDAKDSKSFVTVAQLFLKYRHVEAAMLIYKRALLVDSANSALWKVYARLLRAHNRESSLEKSIGFPKKHRQWGDVYFHLGRWSDALTQYQKALKQHDDPEIWLQIGQVHHRQGKSKARDKAYRRYLAEANGTTKAHIAVSDAYLRNGESKLARVHLSRIAGDPSAPFGSIVSLARLHREAGRSSDEQEVLARWARSGSKPAVRSQRFRDVATYFSKNREFKKSYKLFLVFLNSADGSTPAANSILFEAALLNLKRLRNYEQAAEHFGVWIQRVPAKERFESYNKVVSLLQNVRQMQRFRNRLLEDMVRERPAQPATHFLLGESYLTSRPSQADEALLAFQQYVRLSSDKEAAIRKAGQRLQRARKFRHAADIYRQLPVGNIDDAALNLELATVFLRVNDKLRAKQHVRLYLTQVQTIQGPVLNRLRRFGRELTRRGLYDSAAELFRRILPLEKNKAFILSSLGAALLGKGSIDEAEAVYKNYIATQGNRSSAIRVVAEAFYAEGQYKQARRYYERLFQKQIRSRYGSYFARLADVYLKQGDTKALLAACRKFVDKRPNARSFSRCASYLERASMKEEAMSFLQKAVSRQPRSSQLREKLARVALEQGEFQTADRVLRERIKQLKSQPAAWVKAAELLSSHGQDNMAITLLDDGIQAGIQGGELELFRGQLYLRKGRPEQGHSDFVSALNKSVVLDKVLLVTRESYVRAGKIDKYADLLGRAHALYPNRHETLLELGDMALMQGRKAEAHQYFQRYVAKNGNGALDVAARLRRSGDLAAATRFYQRALNSPVMARQAKAFESLIAVIAAQGEPGRVDGAIKQFLSAAGSSNDKLRELATIFSRNGYVNRAIQFYKLMMKKTVIPGGHQKLGRLYLMAGRLPDAKRAFQHYVTHGEGSAMRKFGRSDRGGSSAQQRARRIFQVANDYEAMGYEKRAQKLLSLAVADAPRVGRYYLQRARLLLISGQTDKAGEVLEAMVKNRAAVGLRGPDLHRLHHLLAVLGREREAYGVLQKIPEAERSLAMSFELVDLPLRLGDVVSATSEANRILSRDDRGVVEVHAGNSFLRAGLIDRASEHFHQVLQPGKGTAGVSAAARALLIIGRLRGDKNAPDEVVRSVARIYQDLGQRYRTLADVFFAVGYFEEAARYAEQWMGSFTKRPLGTGLLNPRQPNPWRLLVLANIRMGKVDEALVAARSYIAKAKKPREARLGMAAFFKKNMVLAPALALYEEAVSADLSDRDSRLMAGRLALDMGSMVLAKEHFDAYVAQGDNRKVSFTIISKIYAVAGYAREAKQYRERAGQSKEPPGIEHIRLALRTDDMDAALNLIQQQVSRSADPVTERALLCTLYFQSRIMSAQMALRLADEALAARPSAPHPVAMLARAAALAELGRDDAARKQMSTLVTMGGADVPALTSSRQVGSHAARIQSMSIFVNKALYGKRMQLVRWALGEAAKNANKERALSRHLSIIKSVLDDQTLQWTATEKQMLVDHATGFLKYLRLRLSEQSWPWLVTVESDLNEHVGDLKGAIAVYEDAIRKFPGNATYKNNLAYLYSRHGIELEKALVLVRAAEAINPEENLYYLDTEGWILYQMGHYEKALAQLQAAVRHMSEESGSAVSESLYHLGLCHLKLGQKKEAMRHLKRAVQLDPEGVFGQKSDGLYRELQTSR